jgi:cytochrome c
MRNFIAGSLCALTLMAITLAGYMGLGLMEVAADLKPSPWETALMTSAVHASVGRQAPSIHSPLPNSDATLVAGGKLYMNDCVGCHGEPGKPPSDFGLTFFPRVPQFPHVGSRYSQAELFWVATHGIRMSGMYPQAPTYADSDRWRLAAFIERIRDLPPAVVTAIQPRPSP